MWFKVNLGLSGNPKTGLLIEKYGHAGLGRYIVLVDSICSHYFLSGNEKYFVKPSHLSSLLKLRGDGLNDFMSFIYNEGLVDVELQNDNNCKNTFKGHQMMGLSLPNMLELFKLNKQKRDRRVPDPDLDPDPDGDKIPEQGSDYPYAKTNKLIEVNTSKPVESLIEIYSDCFYRKYEAVPKITLKDKSILQRLINEHGYKEISEFIEAYFRIDDHWFTRNIHSISVFSVNLQKISTYIQTGRIITFKEAKGIEEASHANPELTPKELQLRRLAIMDLKEKEREQQSYSTEEELRRRKDELSEQLRHIQRENEEHIEGDID